MKIQFSLKSLFCIVLCSALIVSVALWAHWWVKTRHMRNLYYATLDSSINADTKLIIKKLAWSESAWDSGLIHELTGQMSIRQVQWKGVLSNGNTVYIFDAFIRPVANTPIPLICIILNHQLDVQGWSMVAPYSLGFIEAEIDKNDLLTIVTNANFFNGEGIYMYTTKNNIISLVGDAVFQKYTDKHQVMQVPKLIEPDCSQQNMIDQVKEAPIPKMKYP